MDDRKKVLPIRKPSTATSSCSGLRIATIVASDVNGHHIVVFAGEATELAPARITSSAKKNLPQGSAIGREVLVAFDAEMRCPIIVDTLHPLRNEQSEESSGVLTSEEMADQSELILKAKEEIVLQCGDASISLTSAGKVVIKGNYLVSRSSGTTSIKGSSVRIN